MYRLTTVKTIAGSSIPVPQVTCDSKPQAVKSLEAAIRDAESELNAPHIRLVGGRVEITLEECAHVIGGNTDVIEHATIKRPINSPHVEVFRVW